MHHRARRLSCTSPSAPPLGTLIALSPPVPARQPGIPITAAEWIVSNALINEAACRGLLSGDQPKIHGRSLVRPDSASCEKPHSVALDTVFPSAPGEPAAHCKTLRLGTREPIRCLPRPLSVRTFLEQRQSRRTADGSTSLPQIYRVGPPSALCGNWPPFQGQGRLPGLRPRHKAPD